MTVAAEAPKSEARRAGLPRASRRWLVALVLVAVGVRLALFAAATHPYQNAGLVSGEGEVARNIATNDRWFVLNRKALNEVRRLQDARHRLIDPSEIDARDADRHPDLQRLVLETPGTGLLLAGIWKASGDQRYWYLQLLQILLDACLVALVYWIALKLFARPRAALVAAGLYAVFLPLAALVNVPYLDAWATFATIGSFALFLKARSSPPGYTWLVALGACAGLGTYFRPALVVLPLVLALAALPSDGWRRALRLAAVPLLVSLLLMTPWTVRNYAEFHRFIPMRTGIGQNLWEGLGELPNSFGATLDDDRTFREVHRLRPDLRYGTPAYDDYLRQKGLDAIKAHPAFFLKVVARRIALTTFALRNYNWVGHAESPFVYANRTGKSAASYLVDRPWDFVKIGVATLLEPLLFLLGLVTVVLTWRRLWRPHLLLIAVPVATIAPYLLLHVEPRYMLPASFVYLILAGLAADTGLARLGRRRAARASLAPAGGELPQPAGERRLRSDVFLTFGGRIAALVLNLGSSVVIARALGPAGRGSVAVAFNMMVLLVQLGSFGFTSANPYFAARDPAKRPRIVSNSLWLAGSLGLVLIAIGALTKLVLPGLANGISWTVLLIALAGIPGMLAALFLQSVLLGLGRMVAYNVVDVLVGFGTLVALLIGLFGLDFGVAGALAMLSASQFVAATLYLLLLARMGRMLAKPDGPLAASMIRYAFRVYVSTLLAFLVIRADLLLVNGYIGRTEAGLYSVAAALGEGLYLLPAVVAVNLFARVARGAGQEVSAEIFRSIAVLYGLICIVSIPLAGPAVHVLYGVDYSGAIGLFYWLLPGIFSLGMVNILAHHFAGRGYPLEAMLVWFAGVGVNLAINVAFLGREGTYIASLSSSVAYTLLLLLHMRLFAKEAGGYRAMRPSLREVRRFVRVALSRAPA